MDSLYQERVVYGVSMIVLSTLLMAFMGLFVKLSIPYVSTSEIVFFQCLIALIFVLPIMMYQREPLKTKKLPLHVLRALTGTGAWYLLYQSISLTSLTIGTLLTFSSPLLIPFIAHFVLKTKVKSSVWYAIVLGFFGIVLVLNPLQDLHKMLSFGVFVGAFSAVLMAITQFVLRGLRKTETTMAVLFYYLLLSTIIFLPSALMNWNNPPLFVWALMIVTGLLMAISQFLFTYAYRFASPVHTGAFIYLTIVFAALLDAFVLHTHILVSEWVGIGLVILGGVLVMRLEARK